MEEGKSSCKEKASPVEVEGRVNPFCQPPAVLLINPSPLFYFMSTIAFVITSKCEEACKYCFREDTKDITLLDFKSRLTSALRSEAQVEKVVITGGNPELNPDFWEICGEVKARGLKLKIHSNYAFKKTWPKYAKIADELSIPIDSLNPKTQPFRSVKNFKQMLAVLKYFEGKVPLQVHTVVSKANLDDLLEVKKFLDEKGFFKKNSWKIFRLVGVNGLEEFELSDKEWFVIKSKLRANPNQRIKFVDNVLEY